MKKKLSSILGVSLALVLAFALVGGFMPANTPEAEAATAFVPNRWNTMPIPGAGGRQIVSGSNVTDFAVHPDGLTIYLINSTGAFATGTMIARSTNGGLSFSWIPEPTAAAGWGAANWATLVAVAPDDPETFAVIEDNGAGTQSVWISETGGATWAELGDPTGATATEFISDIAVSPLRAGCILDREYVVCTYDTTTNLAQAVGVWGDIYVVGASTTWAGLSAAQGIGYDFTSLALAPSWVGERVVVGIGSDNVTAGNTEVPAAGTAGTGDSYMVPISANALSLGLKGPGVVNLDTLTHDSPGEVCAGGLGGNPGAIWSSSVTLPADFDSYSVGNFRVYLGWASTPAAGPIIANGDDVYRVDYSSPKKLEIAPVKAIESVSYWGTVQEGTLFAGEKDSTQVRYTSDPMSGMPTWNFSYKSPTCSTVPLQCTNIINTKVAVASNFGETNTAWGGCTGADSAFSISYDGGASFNGKTFIDEEAASTITIIRDVMPSPDGSYVFMATEDIGSGDHSLWRSDGEPSAGSWWRVGFRTAAQFTGAGTIVRLSPDDDAVYWFDQGALAGTLIRRSTDNGQIWGTRTAGATLLTDAVIESKDVVYMISGANVQKSTNGAKSFGLPVNASLGPLADIAMCPSYPEKPVEGNVIVGADGTAAPGGVALSTDANATWPALLAFTGAGARQVIADKGYADNNILYAGSSTAGEGIYRYEIGYSTSWEPLPQPAAAAATEVMTGLAAHCGLLYGAYDSGAAIPSGAWRYLAAFIPVASMPPTGDMTVGAAAAIFNVAPNSLRACGTDTEAWLFAINTVTPSLLGYADTMAKLTPVLTLPSLVPANPVDGMNEQFTISWPQVSNATTFLVRIYTDEACTDQVYTASPVVPEPGAPKHLVPRSALIGGNYWCRALALQQVPGDGIWSNWSAKVPFGVEIGLPIEVPYGGPQLMGPTPGATGVSVLPGFGWAALYGAEKYEFELSDSPETTARGYFIDALVGLTGENALVTTGWQCDVTLDYETNYYWHVKSITAASESPWSTAVFTTISEAAVPVPPAPPVELPAPVTPAWIWAIVIIGGILVIVVIVLIVVTRKP